MSQSSEFCRHNPLCCFSTSVYCGCCCLFRYQLRPETFGYIQIFISQLHDSEHADKRAVMQCTKVKVKLKLSLCLTKHHTVKTYWGSGGIARRILHFGTRLRWVVSFTPRPLYLQRKSPWYPLDRRLGGPQNRSGHGGEERNSQPPPGIEP
jgi:hypothetical protein